MAELVTITKQDGIADVRLNRPDKYNALSGEMFNAIVEAGESLRDDKSVRVVVLSGNGRGFCAGLDFGSFQGMAGAGTPQRGASAPEEKGNRPQRASAAVPPTQHNRPGEPEHPAQRPALIWKRLPMPTIAAIHGVAFGGGCQIALGTDIRIAAPDAKLSVMEIKWGLIPDMSLTQTLRDLIPLDLAKELTFTGRVLSGTEAKELGLVTHVVADPLAKALELAREIAGKSPDAIRAGKRLLEATWRADPKTGLDLEQELQRGLIASSNQIEAVKANFENRAPKFNDPS
jgi:enoyl-CoA hydratase/carnithine racemase